MSDIESIRSLVEQMLGATLREELWKFLLESGSVQKYLEGTWDYTSLELAVTSLTITFAQPFMGRIQAELTLPMLSPTDMNQSVKEFPLRQVVLSHVLAFDAAKDWLVQSFRYSALHDELLAWSKVDTWIKKQYRIDAESHAPLPWVVQIPVPEEVATSILNAREREELEQIKPVNLTYQPDNRHLPTVQMEQLEYYLPGEKWEHALPFPPRGKLQELEHVSGILALKYGWAKSQATIFVLTGLSPYVTAVSPRLENRYPRGATRIVLSIDPATSPAEVAEQYRLFRRKVVQTRQREITDKHLMLALFTASRPEDEKWSEAMKEWNQQHPEWAYQQVTNFARDANLARIRILNPEINSTWWEEQDDDEESER